MTTIARICTWPVKGLNEVALERTDLVAGEPLLLDRAFGIARGSAMSSGRDPSEFGWKDFIQLKNCPRLATLTSEFDLEEQVLTLKRQGRKVAKGNLSQPIGRTLIEQFLNAYLKEELKSPPKIIGGTGDTGSPWDLGAGLAFEHVGSATRALVALDPEDLGRLMKERLLDRDPKVRAVAVVYLAGGSDPVITAKPEGAWTHVVTDAALN